MRPTIIEKSADQLVAEAPNKVFRPGFARTNPLDLVEYAGKYVCFAAIVTDTPPDEATMDNYEQLMIANGAYSAFVMVGASRIPTDRVPANHDLTITMQAGLDVKLTPVPEV